MSHVLTGISLGMFIKHSGAHCKILIVGIEYLVTSIHDGSTVRSYKVRRVCSEDNWIGKTHT